MSLSVFLVPFAIAGAGAVVSSFSVDVQAELPSMKENETYYKLKTKIKDEALLQETLRNYGSESSVIDEHIESVIGDVQITFYKEENDTFSAVFHEEIDLVDAEEFIDNIYSEYTRIIQQNTYEKLMERASNEGLIFESEKHSDDSIVLTFQVKD